MHSPMLQVVRSCDLVLVAAVSDGWCCVYSRSGGM
jgi:hypothetical protein